MQLARQHAALSWKLAAGLLLVGLAGGCAALPSGGNSDALSLDAPARKSPLSFSRGKKEAEASYARQLGKGKSLESAGKLVEARDIYQKLIVEKPEKYEAYHRLAVVADRQRRHREAQALYAQAIERESKNAEIFNDLGYSLFLDGQMSKAESALFKAVTLAPSQPRYRNNLGLVFGQQGKLDEALEAFRHAGGEADAQYNLAFVHASKNDTDAAKLCFRRALAADPTHEAARRALGSFDRFDADPVAAEVAMEYAPDGTRYVPYIEPGQSDSSLVSTPQVMPAHAVTPAQTAASGGASFATTNLPGATTHANAATSAADAGSGVTTASHWNWPGSKQAAAQ